MEPFLSRSKLLILHVLLFFLRPLSIKQQYNDYKENVLILSDQSMKYLIHLICN